MEQEYKMYNNKWGIFTFIIIIAFLEGILFSGALPHLPSWKDYKGFVFVFYIGLILMLFFLGKFFDTKPVIIMTKEGFWSRKSILPFTKMYMIGWGEIAFFYEKKIMGAKGVSRTELIIKLHDPGGELVVKNIGYVKQNISTVKFFMRKYGAIHGLFDAGDIKTGNNK